MLTINKDFTEKFNVFVNEQAHKTLSLDEVKEKLAELEI